VFSRSACQACGVCVHTCVGVQTTALPIWNREYAGVLLSPSESESRCDNIKVAGPLVQHDGEKYLMWYYSQGTTSKIPPTMVLPLGDIALATSPDGLVWTRQEVSTGLLACHLCAPNRAGCPRSPEGSKCPMHDHLVMCTCI
jgi:hypothetical protein